MRHITSDVEPGTIDPRLDVQVGDRMQVIIVEGRRTAPHEITETPVTHTFEVESVDNFDGHLWCRGPIVETDCDRPEHQHHGQQAPPYLGHV